MELVCVPTSVNTTLSFGPGAPAPDHFVESDQLPAPLRAALALPFQIFETSRGNRKGSSGSPAPVAVIVKVVIPLTSVPSKTSFTTRLVLLLPLLVFMLIGMAPMGLTKPLSTKEAVQPKGAPEMLTFTSAIIQLVPVISVPEAPLVGILKVQGFT